MRVHFFDRSLSRAVTLLEPFEDFALTIRSYSRLRKYQTTRTIRPIFYPIKIPLRDLRKLVRLLNERYPDHNYRLTTVTLFSQPEVCRNFMEQTSLVYSLGSKRVISRQFIRIQQPRRTRYHIIRRGKCCLDNPPVYYDPRAGRFFVPASYVERHKRLTHSVIYYRLRSLGVV